MYGESSAVKSVKPLTGYVENESVCHFGGTTGWRCGFNKSDNSLQRLDEYAPNRIYRLYEAFFCGGAGDSGGPVTTSRYNALGIFVGVLKKNTSNTCGPSFGGSVSVDSIYQPLAPYLAVYKNVKLMTN